MGKTTIILPFYLKLGMVLVSLIALFYIAILGKGVLAPMIFALLSATLLLSVIVTVATAGTLLYFLLCGFLVNDWIKVRVNRRISLSSSAIPH